LDWDDLKITLAIARHGSLNAAARALGTTQPTVGRRLDRLERRIGARLFERGPGGLSPTPLCSSMTEALAEMEAGAQGVERRIAARDPALRGPLTVTSLAWLGDIVIAPLLAKFSAHHALVRVTLINDRRRFNLSRREADLALRIGSFDQENLIQRKVADVAYGLYVSRDYLNRHGPPDFGRGCAGHFVTSLIETSVKVRHIEWMKAIAPRARQVLHSDGLHSHLAVAEAGEAMAVLPRIVGDRRPTLLRLETPRPEPCQSVTMGVHADMRDAPRLRALIDFLVTELKSRARDFNPEAATMPLASSASRALKQGRRPPRPAQP